MKCQNLHLIVKGKYLVINVCGVYKIVSSIELVGLKVSLIFMSNIVNMYVHCSSWEEPI